MIIHKFIEGNLHAVAADLTEIFGDTGAKTGNRSLEILNENARSEDFVHRGCKIVLIPCLVDFGKMSCIIIRSEARAGTIEAEECGEGEELKVGKLAFTRPACPLRWGNCGLPISTGN